MTDSKHTGRALSESISDHYATDGRSRRDRLKSLGFANYLDDRWRRR
jgi:hypothetical protein